MTLRSRPIRAVVQTALPAIALSIGIVVLAGWWLKSAFLVQLHPNFAPMQFNTALGFVAMSLGVLCAQTVKRRSRAGVWPFIALGLATASLLQYLLHTNFGIDTFFVEPFVTTLTSHPGRMAPNSGLAFILSSLAMLFLLLAQKAWPLFVACGLALGSLALGLSGLLGYVLQLETTYGWSDFTRMAVHTALLHTMLSGAILLMLNTHLEGRVRSQALLHTIGALGVGVVISGLLFFSAYIAETGQVRASLQREALLRRAAIQYTVDSNLRLLQAVERLFASSSAVDRDEFKTFVMPFFEPDGSIVAFDWSPRIVALERAAFEQELRALTWRGIQMLDSRDGSNRLRAHTGAEVYYPVQYVVPERYHTTVLGFDHYSDPLRAAAIDEAARTGTPRSSALLQLFRLDMTHGGLEDFLVFVPSYVDGSLRHPVESANESQVRGFVIGVFRLSYLLRQAQADFPRNEFDITVYEATGVAAGHAPAPPVLLPAERREGETAVGRERVTTTIEIAGRDLRLEFTPTTSFLARQPSFYPTFVLLGSLVMTILSASYFYFVQRQQETLYERELCLRMAIEGAALGIWDWYPQTGVAIFNDQWYSMLGYDAAEMRPHGDLWAKLVHADDKAAAQAALAEHVAGNTAMYRSECRLQGKDGAWIWVLSAGRVVHRDITGQPTRVVGIHLDITALKEAQFAASHAQRQLMAFIEHAPAAVAMLDTQMHFMTCSHRWLQDYDLAGQEILGRPFYEVFPKAPPLWREMHQRCLQGAVESGGADMLTSIDGERQHLRWEARPWFDEYGFIGGVAIFTEDISQFHALIAELAAARDQALAATRAKSDFLASMSHEIRTPMNAILGMADLLNETPLTLEQQDFVRRFRRAGEYLLTLINDVLDLAKIEAEQLELDLLPFHLEELLYTVGELMAVRAHVKGLELIIAVAPDVPQHLIGDAPRLRQILLNLVGNAIKFTDRGEVRLYVEHAPEAQQPGQLRFSVRDTGIGIPADKLQMVFQSFTQADSSTTRKYGGTGLGLSISQRLVQLMHGKLQVDSQVGVGSTFFFTVPLKIDAIPHHENAALCDLIREQRILVVDDNETNRQILRQTLEREGAFVVEASGADAGLLAWQNAQYAHQPFGIALIDCQMPDKDGFYFVEQLKAAGGDTRVVLMLSSANQTGTQRRCRELGTSGYMLKPVTRFALYRAIADTLSLREQTPPSDATVAALQTPPMDAERALNILVAEDNEDNQTLIKSYLKKTPHHLTLAENGAVAVEHCKTTAYDLIFMDMQMPVMDGYTATASIRQWEQTQQRPPGRIIALTANALAEDVQKSLAAGCDGHLSKPIKKATLLAAIAEYAGSVTPTV